LRVTFDEDAVLYDRARPGYPAAVFADLADLADLRAGARVLEIGPGTGKATVPLAERGYEIVAVEIGPAMAAVARRNLSRFPGVEVAVAAFETWPLPDTPFDAVVSATAFHWIDPAVGVSKAADALRVGGTLATIATHHVAGGTADFFAEVQACYERWMPGTKPGLRLQAAADVPYESEDVDRSGRFAPAVFRRHEWDAPYSAATYLDVLRSYSGHRALDHANQAGLFDCIASLIETRYGGRIVKRYMTELRVARRTP
jgi:SAM-dependent methyltransferase